jgi:hypothetical protein
MDLIWFGEEQPVFCFVLYQNFQENVLNHESLKMKEFVKNMLGERQELWGLAIIEGLLFFF